MKHSKRQLKASRALNLDLFHSERLAPPPPATLHTLIRQKETVSVEAIDPPVDLRAEDRLPTVDELYQLFDRFNWMYFQGKLPRTRLEYSNRMTSAGAFIPSQKLIRIGRKYHTIFPEDLADTLKHEMIHLIHLKHNAAFKAEAKRVGASLRAKAHPELRRPPRYLYACPSCQMEYPRQKRLIMASCGSCSTGGRFDRRFKLRLKK